MTAVEFQAALDHLGINVADFAFISGAREDRVERWKRGEEDIAGFVGPYCATLTMPGALDIAFRTAQYYCEEAPAS
jgi:hypothetical protein